MMNITVICVGKIKEKYFVDGANEYIKRLGRFCKLNIVELKDEPTPENPSETEKAQVLSKEGEKILSKIPKNAYIISLCVEGKQNTSEELSEKISKLSVNGCSHIVFIIGGSFGIFDKIKKMSAEKLSFSKMTFPHQLMRVILLEQIYRAFTISSGITYHK